MNTEQIQVLSRPRHLRYIFFIDESYKYDDLVSLINRNQRFWGGRYNPIIPVAEKVIQKEYLEVLKYYDPDYIFYSKTIDVEFLKQLRLFNPSGYYCLDEKPPRETITGVDTFNLFSQFPDYWFSRFINKVKIVYKPDLVGTENPLFDFYKINFGIGINRTHSYDEIINKKEIIYIDEANISSINKLICEQKPINQAHLARQNLNTRILRSEKSFPHNSVELVIARDKSSITDLLYFWNRQLFECGNVIYSTIEEINILVGEEYFGKLLSLMSIENPIYVVSTSLTKSELETIIETKLKSISFYKSFTYKDVKNFPFEIMDANGLIERNFGETQSIQIFSSNNGIYFIPKLSFTEKLEYYPQQYAIDIQLKKSTSDYRNNIKFPYNTDTEFLFRDVKGRINRIRDISIIIHNQINTTATLDVNISSFRNLIRQITHHPIIDGDKTTTKYIDSGFNDNSNKLAAFIKLFDNNFSTISDFFSDKFWVGIFEHLSTNDMVAGEAISFEEIKTRCIDVLSEKKIKLEEKEKTVHNEENLSIGLKRTIQELCNFRVLLKGFKLKCINCSSAFWYHIEEVGDTIKCKGCLQRFELPIEPNFSYKLNDLIRNNLFQPDSQRDGNLTVIRTLVLLKDQSRNAFEYTPQLDLFTNYYSKKPESEIDIVCLVDGLLIIGEAKHNSERFSENGNKCLKSLVEVAKAIHPDKIVLSCYIDKYRRLEKAKQGLIHLFNKWEYEPEIETFILSPPDYFHLDSHRYFWH